MTSNDTDSTEEPPISKTGHPIRLSRVLPITAVILLIAAVAPALAQSPICNSKELIKMIEGFFQLTTSLGAVALPIVWQADYLIEIVAVTQEQQRALQRHRRKALKSAVTLFVLGPIYTIAGPMMGLPLSQCNIDLILL